MAFPVGDEYPQARMGRGWGWIMAYGVVSLLLGIGALAWPFSATIAATLVIGAFFIAGGVMAIAAGLFGHGHESRGYSIAFGVLSLVVGLYMAFEPVGGAISLTLLVAIWLGVRGVLELVWGFRIRFGRGWMIVLGLVNILLAVIVLSTLPFSALTLPGYLLGISFLMGGITAIASAAHHRKGAAAFAVPE